MGCNFFLLYGILLSAAASAQQLTIQQPALAGFEYIEVVKGRDNGKLPLLIAFHYSGGTPTETIADYDSLKVPVRIIFPRGNFAKRKGFSFYPTDYYQQADSAKYSIALTTVDSLAKFSELVEKKYGGPALLSGISQGGDIVFLLAKTYPDLCKAALPFAAVIHDNTVKDLQENPVATVPVYLFQGEADPIVKLQETKKQLEAIGNKMNIKLYTYPGLEHDISREMKIDYSLIIDSYNRE